MAAEQVKRKVDEGEPDQNTISPIERELDNVIEDILSQECDDVRAALNNFKGKVVANYLLRLEMKIASLEALVSLIGAQDKRVMQLLTYIDRTR